MISKWKQSFKRDGIYAAASFLIPFFLMFAAYLSLGIYWGSDRSVLASDAFSQFSNFHASFRNALHGEQSLFYTWNASLGINYWSLISYYLGGIFTPLVFFFKNENIPDALYLLTMIKIGAAGLAFWSYGKRTFKIERWSIVALSVAYSLMSFVTAQSELIMWLDIFMYFPLIILGINQIFEKGRSIVLFVSYLLLFISNFYFGFIIGLFSVMYYAVQCVIHSTKWKQTIVPYFTTAILAGLSSMVMILPAVMDLRTNGEKLTEMSRFKTDATSFWDIINKNMIGVFDTTKYGSIPFIYVGLLPLIFCIFYFVTKKIPLKNKLAYGAVFAIIIASFYIDPLNLIWHGLHAPNMFLFRFSFIFSFLVVMLAGYGWEKFRADDKGYLVGTVLILAILFSLGKLTAGEGKYEFVTYQSLLVSILFLAIYLTAILFYQFKKIPMKQLSFLLLLVVIGEAFLNTNFMVNGILKDWNYASRSLYSEPYKDYKKLVDKATAENGDTFYRLESLAPISANDSFNYGFSGISMFSSIRNRHSSAVLDSLGYRSEGTNLNIRYQNNTLFMDSLVGIRHNISNQPVNKFGFKPDGGSGKYQLFQNDLALPLGVMTTTDIYKIKQPTNDNLTAQKDLINQLANYSEGAYFKFVNPVVESSKNTKITKDQNNNITYAELKPNMAKEITYNVAVPGGNQAYISLFPSDFGKLGSSTVTVKSQGTSYNAQIGITGQYYNLGYFPSDATVQFTLTFQGSQDVSFINPPVMLMDTNYYQSAMTQIKQNGVAFKTGNRSAKAKVETPEKKVIFTTIPYDKGWTVKVNGKKVETKPFWDGLLTFEIPAGTSDIKMSYLPVGFIPGLILFFGGIIAFTGYYRWTLHTKQQPLLDPTQSASNLTTRRSRRQK
ncbi:YfhO family protein [Vagococcus vulneris]|uniref:Copper ABC transporter permease n=1 Tax=Vagococcus vulneris TaxID=1977869 RepID=A0A430A0J5_9ENTE|nr:YfhO family protein [Vagococcus vulneris]RST99844.1 copper ABC transporter permease [Vagococcus vulneris]